MIAIIPQATRTQVVGHCKSGGLNRLDWSWPVSPTKALIDQSY